VENLTAFILRSKMTFCAKFDQKQHLKPSLSFKDHILGDSNESLVLKRMATGVKNFFAIA